MTDDRAAHYTLLEELDARQDHVLEELEQLNARVKLLLTEFTRPPGGAAPPEQTEEAA